MVELVAVLLYYICVLWKCYVFNVFLFNVILLAVLRHVLGRCINIYCVGSTYRKCVLWCPVVWCGRFFPWHCLSVNCCVGSGKWKLSVMCVLSCRCLGAVVAVGWDRPFVVHKWAFPFGGICVWKKQSGKITTISDIKLDTYIQLNLPKTERDRSGIFFSF
jgi:hypothetical protein